MDKLLKTLEKHFVADTNLKKYMAENNCDYSHPLPSNLTRLVTYHYNRASDMMDKLNIHGEEKRNLLSKYSV